MVDQVLYSSERGDWMTPDEIIEFVTFALGGVITLDPCCNLGEPNVKAEYYYTEETDGLANKWWGKVYMNSPYGREIKVWVQKLADEFWHGDVDQAIALVPVRTDTQWWETLVQRASCVLFLRGRLQFKGAPTSAPFPSALVCLGVPPRQVYLGLVRFKLKVKGRLWEPWRGG